MRARVILYNKENNAVLLIHRFKNGRNYWVIPGGGAKGHETPVETVIREIEEELNIQLRPTDLIHFFKYEEKEYEEFYYAKIPYIVAPKISGEERERSSSNNVYQPEWVASADLTQINLMPPEIAAKIVTLIWQKNSVISYYYVSEIFIWMLR